MLRLGLNRLFLAVYVKNRLKRYIFPDFMSTESSNKCPGDPDWARSISILTECFDPNLNFFRVWR